jgi:hypothetical protein
MAISITDSFSSQSFVPPATAASAQSPVGEATDTGHG